MSIYDEIARRVAPCDTCGAQPGQACKGAFKVLSKPTVGCHWRRRQWVQTVWRPQHEQEYGLLKHKESLRSVRPLR